ncbi:MAG: hypothetical protein KME11_11370 [Timaviella obliquedivisa GSE-PSE-MK23-08B]|jgi:uncharacterized protein (DUF697 family)|nr:hypothetical protein [Timaviella obliquedivisa GSE-PSE-MK23-08B]
MNIFSAARSIARNVTQYAVRWISGTASGTGQVLGHLANIPGLNNPFVRRVASVLRLDWLLGITNRVDVEKVKTNVQTLRQQHPNESPSQIVHRLMVKKAVDAGKIGFMSSLIPGLAVALLAIDLAATTALQTELVYEIAATYGLDLDDPARKGEVLAIFGLSLGGSNAVKAGLGFLRNVPLAGTLIGASTNATILYAVGYAASRFYEAKLDSAGAEPTTEALHQIQEESEQYLNTAIAQEMVMDQILAHMILASYPNKTWENILPELKTIQFEPNSLKNIQANLRSPQPLDTLLQQLDCDFAVPLFAQCQQLAQSNRLISIEENKILEAIASKCKTELL